ncbi:MAG: PucR family transcriptional regulator [Oscillospiraceae bacterium]|jgi:carbohydrate diacid regulator
MSSRIFQGIVLQLKASANNTIGIIDAEGNVIACSDISKIGEHWFDGAEAVRKAGDAVAAWNGWSFRQLSDWNGQFDYAAFAKGEETESGVICSMAAVALNNGKTYYEEKHDKATFIKNIISDNILLGDIYIRAKELHVASEVPRGVLLIRQTERVDPAALDIIQTLFPDKQADFVLSVSENEIAVIKQMPEDSDSKELNQMAETMEETLGRELQLKCAIGIGSVVTHLRDLARAYKEAQVAIDVGKVFETEKTIINYENLGIGRLIYQLPTTLCEMFLQEIFKKSPIDALDSETLFTINKFFENNLNVSETARKLFVHRNTLVYRLEKIKKLTGLDLREFDDAITFKVALMVKKYLVSRGVES